MDDAEVDHHRGEHYDGSEIVVKTKAFYCSKKKVNLYSFGFDRFIGSFDPAMINEGEELVRMPNEIDGCREYEEENSKPWPSFGLLDRVE